eukprot:Seg4399.2 transcript_id=Seg4399.2/GoldUCD/mRNA.D3Y31 product="Tetratricopeptide repeat protein 28" protein_id=Seg4399.2/GoldUCD/D3Y31
MEEDLAIIELNRSIFQRDKRAIVNSCDKLGILYLSLKKYDKSREYFDRALNLVEELETGGANYYMMLCAVYLKHGQLENLFECIGMALDLARKLGDLQKLASIYILCGHYYECCSKLENAVRCDDNGLSIAYKINNDNCIKMGLYCLGKVHLQNGSYKKAIMYLSQYVELREDTGIDEDLLKALDVLADAYHLCSNRKKALVYYEHWLQHADSNVERKAAIYVKVGWLYAKEQNHDMAFEYLKKATEIVEVSDDLDLEINVGHLASELYARIGNHDQSISVIELLEEKVKKVGSKQDKENFAVLKFTRKSESCLYQSANDTIKRQSLRLTENPANFINMSLRSFTNFVQQKEFEEAEKVCGKMFSMSARTGNKYLEIAALVSSLGLCDMRDDYEKMAVLSQKSLKIALETGDQQLEGAANLSQAVVEYKRGRMEEARRFNNRALHISNESNEVEMQLDALKLSMRIELHAQPDMALSTLTDLCSKVSKAVSLISDNGRIHWHMILAQHYELLLTENNFSQSTKSFIQSLAESHAKKAIHFHEVNIKGYGRFDMEKTSAFKRYNDLYKDLSRTMIIRGKVSEALIIVDRGRMFVLRERLSNSYQMPLPEHSENQELDLDAIENSCVKGNSSVVFFSMENKGLLTWIISKRGIQFFISIEFKFKEEGVSFEERKGPEYFIGLVVCSILEEMDSKSEHPRAMKRDDPNTPFEEYCDDDLAIDRSKYVSQRGNSNNSNIPQDPNFGDANLFEMLYDWLIAPILDKLTGEEVIIVPDSYMFLIPFNALKNRVTGEYLSDTKRVRIVPSLLSMQILDHAALQHHSQGGVLIIAANDIGTVKYEWDEAIYSKLPFAEKEAQMIGKLLSVHPLIGTEATKSVVTGKLADGNALIHICAHGLWPGKIILTPDMTSSGSPLKEKDHILYMHEVMKIGIKAQLVVLSCCKSGKGEVDTEMIIGFARAFLAAGARAVVVALWNVNDKATYLLMEQFYTSLIAGKSASESLNLAMKEVRKMEEYKAEKYWAPFVLIGDDVILKLDSTSEADVPRQPWSDTDNDIIDLEMYKRHLRYYGELCLIEFMPWFHLRFTPASKDVKRDIHLFSVRFAELLKTDATCDCCRESLLGKDFYRCVSCLSVEMCESCFSAGWITKEHTKEHRIIPIRFTCVICKARIFGTRIHCDECIDFDLCFGCYKETFFPEDSSHKSSHRVTRHNIDLSMYSNSL